MDRRGYSTKEFEDSYSYKGTDLGANWTVDATTFKVWAPTAEQVQVALYESGTAGTEDRIRTLEMTRGAKGSAEAGVWTATAQGNLNGTYYTYLVQVECKEIEACDPYARTTGVNGKRAMVLDLNSTDPEGWEQDMCKNGAGSVAGWNYTDAVLYELHVRDFSIDESSGVSEAHRGKFLGLTEEGTRTPGGAVTGLDYLKELGITHLQLLPVYDYGSVDESRLEESQFNWGYDPVNYNVPEGSYSTDPYHGEVRVREMKQMVQALHAAGIHVVMDVVYNHVYDAETFCFNQIVPQYFSRVNEEGVYSNGSFCGNDTASERSMVHKYIVDSVCYWAEEYHIDGFRFDLVGLLDVDTINDIVSSVHAKHPHVIFYGEGWDMPTIPTREVELAIQKNADKTPGFAYFSDNIRDLLAGRNGETLGFVSGLADCEEKLRDCFLAQTTWCPAPVHTINYVSCHDNYTLFDKLRVSLPETDEEERIRMNKLAAAIYMTAQGIPFLHAGEEFLRIKEDEQGNIAENSYNAPDYVNKIRWSSLEDPTVAAVVEYYKELIRFRQAHPALRLTTAEEVAERVHYQKVADGVVLFEVTSEDENILLVFNATKETQGIDLTACGVNMEMDKMLMVEPISAMIFVK